MLTATAAFAIAGCGDDEPDTGGAPAVGTTPVETSASGTGGTTSAGTVEVTMKASKFIPAELTSRVGQKIRWRNADNYEHDVTAREGADFSSDTIDGGGTFEHVLEEEGTIEYVCTIHPGMSGTIEVGA